VSETRWRAEFYRRARKKARSSAAARRSAILGALSLYLNFINLFTMLLQLLGQREE
jgi:FtsH-binding integral membrane protein